MNKNVCAFQNLYKNQLFSGIYLVVQIMLTFGTPILHICNNFMNKHSILQNTY
jgi:hypothetical protein